MNRSAAELSPQHRYYLGEITAEDAAQLHRQRVTEERRDSGYAGLNKAVVVIGVLFFLPALLIEAFTNRR